MSQLSTSPPSHTLVRVEARKSFAFAVEVIDAAGNLVDLTDCVLSLVVAKAPHRGGETVLEATATMLADGQGRAQFMLQAADLDLAAGEYGFALVMITADEYSAVLAKGILEVVANVDTAAIDFSYDVAQPAQLLTAKLLKDNRVQVKVAHLPYPELQIGSIQTVENYEDAGASIEGVYPLQLLHLTLPKGGVGEPGPAPEIEIGTVSMAGPGLAPSASITGTQLVKQLNLVLPQPEAWPLVAVPQADGVYAMSSPIITDNGDGTVTLDLDGSVTFASAEHTHTMGDVGQLTDELDQIRDSVEALRARVPDWTAGAYRAEQVVAFDGSLWRARTDTSARPGPEIIEMPVSGPSWQLYTSNPGVLTPVGPDGIATVGDAASVWNYGVLFSQTFSNDILDGFAWEFEYKSSSNSGYKDWDVGLHKASDDPTPWSSQTTLITDATTAEMTTGGSWAWGRIECALEDQVLKMRLYRNGALVKEVSGTRAALSGGFRLRFRAYSNRNTSLQVRNTRLIGGVNHPDWEELVELGASRHFTRLLGIPNTFPPSDHDAARITTGTIAPSRLPLATETASGIAERATLAEVAAGTDTYRFVTPLALQKQIEALGGAIANWLLTRNPFRPQVGDYLLPKGLVDSTNTTPSSGVITFVPFDVEYGATYSHVAYKLANPAAGGAVALQFAVYQDNGDGNRPDTTKRVAITAVDPLTAGSDKELALDTPVSLNAGRHWLAAFYLQTTAPDTPPILHGINRYASGLSSPGIFWFNGGYPARCLELTGQTALPTTATGPAPSYAQIPVFAGLKRSE